MNQQQEQSASRQEGSSSHCYSILGFGTLCVQNEQAAKADAQRSEDDLQAQQDMAEWGRWITLVTGVQAVIGAIGLWFIYRSLEQSNEATRQATEATRAAIEANKIARNSHLAGRRPWLAIRLKRILEIDVAGNAVQVTGRFVVESLSDNPADDVNVTLYAYRVRRLLLSRLDAEREALRQEANARHNTLSSGVVLPGKKMTVDRWAHAHWNEPEHSTNLKDFRIGLIVVVTYRAFGGTEFYHTAETYMVRRMVAPHDATGGFFVRDEHRKFSEGEVEVGHPRICSHAT